VGDVRALTIAEQWFGVGVGVGVGIEAFAIVTIGAGIGCGLYLNGDVVEGDPDLTMSGAAALAHSGHAGAVAAFERAGSSIGMALAAVVNLVGSEVVLLAGEGVADYDLYESRVREVFSEHVFGAAAQCRIVTQSHTFDDCARGAAGSSIRATVRGGLVLRA
jgi:predicted NBD/HSP70 family sugar kinase